jgi:hypothetical protein
LISFIGFSSVIRGERKRAGAVWRSPAKLFYNIR